MIQRLAFATVSAVACCVSLVVCTEAAPNARFEASAPSWRSPAVRQRTALPTYVMMKHFADARRAARPSSVHRGPGVTSYAIVDLGTVPGYRAPIPLAVAANGDAAAVACLVTTACPSYGNGNEAYDPFVYVAAIGRVVPLARFASPTAVSYTTEAIDAVGDRIVGCAMFPNGASYLYRPVMWTRTSALASTIAFLDRDDPNDSACAHDISRAGRYVVGTARISVATGYAVGVAARFTSSGYTPLYSAPGVYGDAFAVNDSGAAAGDVQGGFSGYTTESAAFSRGSYQIFDFPDVYNSGFAPSSAVAIADNGDVAGTAPGPSGDLADPLVYEVGYLYKAHDCRPSDCYSPIGPTTDSVVTNMNNEDAYVGSSVSSPYTTATGPFLDSTFLQDLLPPSTTLLPASANAINDAGAIVGQAYLPNGTPTGYEMQLVQSGCPPMFRLPTCLGTRRATSR